LKLKTTLLKVSPSIVLISGLLAIILLSGFDAGHYSYLAYGADSYGQDIYCVEVWQYNSTHWNMVKNFTSTGDYTRIVDSLHTAFIVKSYLNETLYSSTAEAISYSRVYMNITCSNSTVIWSNVLLNNTACSLASPKYVLYECGNWTSSLPEPSVIYNCSVSLEGYF